MVYITSIQLYKTSVILYYTKQFYDLYYCDGKDNIIHCDHDDACSNFWSRKHFAPTHLNKSQYYCDFDVTTLENMLSTPSVKINSKEWEGQERFSWTKATKILIKSIWEGK